MYKRQVLAAADGDEAVALQRAHPGAIDLAVLDVVMPGCGCLLYTSDAADERSSVDLGGRRIIQKKKKDTHGADAIHDKYNSYTYSVATQTEPH